MLSLRERFNNLKLAFPEKRERAYQDYYFKSSLAVFRIAYPTIILLYAAFGYLDVALVPELANQFLFIRFAVVIPFLLLVYASSFFSFFERIWQWLLFASFLIGGQGIIIMLALAPDNYPYYLGLMLVFSAGYFFVKLDFLRASVAGWLLVLFFNISLIYYTDINSTLLLSLNSFFIGANLINMLAAYYIESINRKNYDLNYQLKLESEELEEKVEQRTHELKKREEDLSHLNATKNRFFSIIAHDLRSPLGTLQQLSDTLKDSYEEMDDPMRVKFASMINTTSKNILRLLENLLEWTRSQQGLIKFEPQYLQLYVLAQNSVLLLDATAKAKHIKIQNNISQEINLEADPDMLDTIFRNFISNAIKYSNKNSEIEIGAKITDKDVVITVVDHGIGMTPTQLKHLFSLDKSIKKRGTRNEYGTGLGLILCKEFVERHGGKLQVQSEVNKGSTFTITLPKSQIARLREQKSAQLFRDY